MSSLSSIDWKENYRQSNQKVFKIKFFSLSDKQKDRKQLQKGRKIKNDWRVNAISSLWEDARIIRTKKITSVKHASKKSSKKQNGERNGKIQINLRKFQENPAKHNHKASWRVCWQIH